MGLHFLVMGILGVCFWLGLMIRMFDSGFIVLVGLGWILHVS